MVSKFFVVVMLCVMVGAVALAVGINYLIIFRIGGEVSVGDAETVNVVLDISTASGSKMFKNVTTVSIKENTAIKFKVLNYSTEGNLTIILNGIATLRSDSNTYRVLMPCLLSIGEPCVRVLMLIPGYDTPLPVEPGKYFIDLEFSWKAKGYGKYSLVLVIESHEYKAEIKVVGDKPESIDGWTQALGSTKSYALMVEKTEVPVSNSGAGTVKAYAWVFKPDNTTCGEVVFKFQLIDIASGKTVAELKTSSYRRGTYCSVLTEIKASAGSYILQLKIEKYTLEAVVLKIPLNFRN